MHHLTNVKTRLSAGMVRLMDNDEHTGPINIGNPTEFTMLELANVVKEVLICLLLLTQHTSLEADFEHPERTLLFSSSMIAWISHLPSHNLGIRLHGKASRGVARRRFSQRI